MKASRLAAVNPRLVAQLGWLFETEANALRRDGGKDEATRREVQRLRDIACELDVAAMNAGYVGYPFGEEA
jgi:hypothetical protein